MNVIAATDYWANIPIGEHLWLVSPMIVLVCTMLAVVTCPILLGRRTRTITAVVAIGVTAAFVMAIRVAMQVADGGTSGLSTVSGSGMLIIDNLSAGYQLLMLAFLGCVIGLWWIGSAATERDAPEFFVLLLGSALGMVLMVSTSNLLMIVMAIEMASLPSYALVSFNKRDRAGAEGGLKYMIFGAICAAIMLYGASLLYGLAGSLNFADIAKMVALSFAGGGRDVVLVSVALLCFFAGVAFKISAVPFHFWCPDAFQAAKIEVTTWLSVVSKAAGLILLVRLVAIFCGTVGAAGLMHTVEPIAWGIAIVAAITCTLGNIAAYRQRSVKRLLAYSSIAHAGYMLMATAVFIHPDVAGSEAGISALLAYVLIYLFMNLGAFGVTAMVYWATGTDDIDAFTGLIRRAPALAIPMIICLMSLVGLPPFGGFLGKWWIWIALGRLDSTLGWFLIMVMGLNTVVSLYYYLRIVVRMTLRDDGQAALRPSFGGMAMVNVCAIVLFPVMFIFANGFKSTADHFARRMFVPTADATVSAEPSVEGDHSAMADARVEDATGHNDRDVKRP